MAALLAREHHYQSRMGVPTEAVPARSLEEAADDAAFMRQLASDSKTVDHGRLTDAERITLRVLLD